ncbi:MAG: peptidoglycan-binding domain-containing protein, partial [Pseudolabrys sp.]
ALIAGAAVLTIFVNALFLQHGPHPAPIFATAARQVSAPAPVVAPTLAPVVAPEAATAPAALSPRVVSPLTPVVAEPLPRPRQAPAATKVSAVKEVSRNDPIAELLAPGKRVAAVQRALSDFGYGQIKPSGVIGPETQTAIEKFERGHKMPVTGQVSDRLVQALSAMTGRPLD